MSRTSASSGGGSRHAASADRIDTKTPASAGIFVRRLSVAAAGLLVACTAVAQTPQYSLETSAVDSVPQTTIVPVQQSPV